MSSEIERELAKQEAALRLQESWKAWSRRYGGAGFQAVHESVLRPADSPHHDLLVDFSTRAIAAGLGVERFVLRGPDSKLYAAEQCPWERGVPNRRLTWSERRDIRRCNARIAAEGRRAVQLQLQGDPWGPRVDVTWLVQGRNYFVSGRFATNWHTREDFLYECAAALRTTHRKGR